MMSKIVRNLEIVPPRFYGKASGEVRVVNGFECSYCKGHGCFAGPPRSHNGGDVEETICPVCKGFGRLKAKILIGWEPDENINQKNTEL